MKGQTAAVLDSWVAAIPHTLYTRDSRIFAPSPSVNSIIHMCHTVHPFFSSLTIAANSSNSTKWSGHSKCFCCM